MSAPATTQPPQPTPLELQAQVEQARADLLATLEELKAQATPAAILQRAGRTVTGIFTDQYGGIRPERVAIVGAVVVGIVAIRIVAWRRHR
jgi:hypothetical protein